MPSVGSAWLCYATISDVHAKAALATQLGGQVLNGPMEVPGGDVIAQCMDPQGAACDSHEEAFVTQVSSRAAPHARCQRVARRS